MYPSLHILTEGEWLLPAVGAGKVLGMNDSLHERKRLRC